MAKSKKGVKKTSKKKPAARAPKHHAEMLFAINELRKDIRALTELFSKAKEEMQKEDPIYRTLKEISGKNDKIIDAVLEIGEAKTKETPEAAEHPFEHTPPTPEPRFIPTQPLPQAPPQPTMPPEEDLPPMEDIPELRQPPMMPPPKHAPPHPPKLDINAAIGPIGMKKQALKRTEEDMGLTLPRPPNMPPPPKKTSPREKIRAFLKK